MPRPKVVAPLFAFRGQPGCWTTSRRPHNSPNRTSPNLEFRVRALRQRKKWGPLCIAAVVGLAPSTVHRILGGRNRRDTAPGRTGLGHRLNRVLHDAMAPELHTDPGTICL